MGIYTLYIQYSIFEQYTVHLSYTPAGVVMLFIHSALRRPPSSLCSTEVSVDSFIKPHANGFLILAFLHLDL